MSDPLNKISILRTALDELPVLSRQVLTLHCCAGFSCVEINRLLGHTPSKVAQTFNAAIRVLRERLCEAGFDYSSAFTAAEFVEAVNGGVCVPPGLRDRVLEYVFQHERNSASEA